MRVGVASGAARQGQGQLRGRELGSRGTCQRWGRRGGLVLGGRLWGGQ